MGRKREYEAPDMGAMMKRLCRAMARRAGDGELEALTSLREVRDALDLAVIEGAQAAHAFGYSWTEIGRELGISRQAARQMFGSRSEASA